MCWLSNPKCLSYYASVYWYLRVLVLVASYRYSVIRNAVNFLAGVDNRFISPSFELLTLLVWQRYPKHSKLTRVISLNLLIDILNINNAGLSLSVHEFIVKFTITRKHYWNYTFLFFVFCISLELTLHHRSRVSHSLPSPRKCVWSTCPESFCERRLNYTNVTFTYV